jgi:hypothetical protein
VSLEIVLAQRGNDGAGIDGEARGDTLQRELHYEGFRRAA